MAATTLPPSRYQRDLVPPGCPLSAREYHLIGVLARGLTYKQIALETGLTHSTVRTHLHNAYRRLGVAGGAAQAILKCEREGWIGSQPGSRTRAEALLEEIKPILEACLAQLEQGTRHRVTRSQYAYLKAFDRMLRHRTPEADESMATALRAVLDDAQVVPTGGGQAAGERFMARDVA
jgi:predicted DNA-binding transcriptional regulator